MWEVKHGAPVVTLDMKAQERFPGYSTILHVLLRAHARKAMRPQQNESFMFGPLPDSTLCVFSLG